MEKNSHPENTLQWLGVCCLILYFLAGCGSQDALRVATENTPALSSEVTHAVDSLPTPEPQTAGSFSVEPVAIHTLPIPGGSAETLEAPTTPSQYGGGDPLLELSIESLASRSYGQDVGTLKIESVLEKSSGFARALVSYPSDGLKIFGFANIPPGDGPFPVMIFIHGYVDEDVYETLDYSVRYADDLTRRGFIVIHPNLRGYPPSDDGPDFFEIGKAIDVLNLVSIVQRDAGKTGLLKQADPNAIAIWGHSTGGGIAIRVVTVNLASATGSGPAVKVAILYAPMSGDEARNAYRTYYTFSGQTRWNYEINVLPEDLIPISPVYHYERIEAAVQIHHGVQDNLIPVEWSRETCAQMEEAGVRIECYDYRTQTHNFCCDSYKWMLDRIVSFSDTYLP